MILEKMVICVDDTDDLTKATSTGAIADEIARRLGERFGSAPEPGITRHQLLLDERVPYTSHNSSMCFEIRLPGGSAPEVDAIGWEVIHEMRAESANPGLCVLPVSPERSYETIIRFGKRAKKELVFLQEAEQIAQMFPEMFLKREGSTGQGMIGALAGVGLRLTGNDGRFRGKYDLSSFSEGEPCTVRQFTEAFQAQYGFPPALIDPDGLSPDSGEKILPVREAKAILNAGRLTFMCGRDPDGIWRPYSKDEFNKKRKKKDACQYFVPDPDKEERFHEKARPACGACLYRRLTSDGYICIADIPESEKQA